MLFVDSIQTVSISTVLCDTSPGYDEQHRPWVFYEYGKLDAAAVLKKVKQTNLKFTLGTFEMSSNVPSHSLLHAHVKTIRPRASSCGSTFVHSGDARPIDATSRLGARKTMCFGEANEQRDWLCD